MDSTAINQVMVPTLDVSAIWWVGTLLWFAGLLLGDLYLHHKEAPSPSGDVKRAIGRSVVWILLSIMLGGLIWWHFGSDAGTKFFSGYLIEKMLSIDNIFVWGLILTYLKVPEQYHYKVLFWGIFGAIVFRTIFVFAGLAIISAFEAALVLLGLVLVLSAWRLLKGQDANFDVAGSKLIKYSKKFLPLRPQYIGGSFWVKENGRWLATMLFLAVCVVEMTDVIFAVDSVPAVLGVAREPYLVLASNIAAILGLRALYFVFTGLNHKFWLLNKGLALILIGIGAGLILEPEKLLGFNWFGLTISTALNLSFIAIILVLSITCSLLFKPPSQTAGA